LQIKTKIVSSHTADSKLVKQEVNSTVILPPLVFPALTYFKKIRRHPRVDKNIREKVMMGELILLAIISAKLNLNKNGNLCINVYFA
jgi:hypothetical protein